MTAKIISALFTAFAASIAGGFICCALLAVLFQIPVSELPPFIMIGGVFLNVVISGCMCTMLLLPIATVEKIRIENSSFEELLRRYLPLISIPFGILICFSFFLSTGNKEDQSVLISYTMNIICMGYICLWTFLKRIKLYNQ